MTVGGRPVVLVVDDQQDVADAFAVRLGERFETRVVYGGDPALEAIDDDVDAVLLDRRMPDRHGDEVLAEIRERGYDCPVIMTTAVDPDLNILEMDFDDYLVKPIDLDELVSTVDEHVATADEQYPRLREFLSIVSKIAVLDDQLTPAELDDSEEYHRLQERADELGTELRDEMADFEEIVSTYRDVGREF